MQLSSAGDGRGSPIAVPTPARADRRHVTRRTCDVMKGIGRHHGAVCLTRDQIQRARRGGAERGAVRIVTHREMLGVVPQRGDRVAIVVAHHQALALAGVEAGGRTHAHGLDEPVHGAGVERLLLVGVVVILIAGGGIPMTEPERLHRVRIVIEQTSGKQSVDERGAGLRRKRRPVGIRRVRIGGEIVVEGDVLLKDDHEMTNGSAHVAIVIVPAIAIVRRGVSMRRRDRDRRPKQRDEYPGQHTSQRANLPTFSHHLHVHPPVPGRVRARRTVMERRLRDVTFVRRWRNSRKYNESLRSFKRPASGPSGVRTALTVSRGPARSAVIVCSRTVS